MQPSNGLANILHIHHYLFYSPSLPLLFTSSVGLIYRSIQNKFYAWMFRHSRNTWLDFWHSSSPIYSLSFCLLHFDPKISFLCVSVHKTQYSIFISWWRFVVISPLIAIRLPYARRWQQWILWMDFNSITFHFWIEWNWIWIYGLIEQSQLSTCIECIIRTFAFATCDG